jgi:hypothetical protein
MGFDFLQQAKTHGIVKSVPENKRNRRAVEDYLRREV